MQLTQWLHKARRERSAGIATVSGSRRRTHAQLVERVARLAGAFKRLGIQADERIGMLALNSDRYVEYLHACWWAGAAVNPINVRWTAAEIAFSLDMKT